MTASAAKPNTVLPTLTAAWLLGGFPGVRRIMYAAKKIQNASRPPSRWKRYIRIASGTARRTPSRACSSNVRSALHIGSSGTGTRAAVTSGASLRLRWWVPTKTTTNPATHPTAMCAAAHRSETSSNRFATRAMPATRK
jgi:hypothetical protein